MLNFTTLKTQNGQARVRTIKKIVPVDQATSPYFAIQILALKDAPNNAAFFENVESAREFSCADGYKRYVVGKYETQEEAQADLARIRAKGPKYATSYVVNTANFQISTSSFNSKFSDEPTDASLEIDKNDKFSHLRTNKKIIPVDGATEPYFAIQLLALRNAPQDPNFFENVNAAREFNCQDGYARYVYGQYDTYEAATAMLTSTRSLSPKYKDAFVVNTSNFQISSTAFSRKFESGEITDETAKSTDIDGLRTNKNIIPVDRLNPEEYSVQVLALKETPKNTEFFDRLDIVKEVSCKDGFKRYLVGSYTTPAEAKLVCDKIRKYGPKYKDAFIISNQKLQVDESVFMVSYQESSNSSKTNATKSVTKTPVNTSKVETINSNDNTETIVTFDEKAQNSTIKANEAYKETLKNNAARSNEAKLETPDLIKTDKGEYVKTKTEQLVNNESTQPISIRTEKKIIPVDKASKPFYTIQVLALKDAPNDPLFFDNIESAREFSCSDGYKRYVVGQYETRDEAAADLERVRNLSPKYKNAFIANTANYDISLTDFRTNYSEKPNTTSQSPEDPTENNVESVEDGSPQKSALNKAEKSSAQKFSLYDPNKIYTIQLTASRYPFYVSELKEFKEVYEFYMPDKVYRYTTGKYSGKVISDEIKKVISFGYTEAFAVELDKYLPYKIE